MTYNEDVGLIDDLKFKLQWARSSGSPESKQLGKQSAILSSKCKSGSGSNIRLFEV